MSVPISSRSAAACHLPPVVSFSSITRFLLVLIIFLVLAPRPLIPRYHTHFSYHLRFRSFFFLFVLSLITDTHSLVFIQPRTSAVQPAQEEESFSSESSGETSSEKAEANLTESRRAPSATHNEQSDRGTCASLRDCLRCLEMHSIAWGRRACSTEFLEFFVIISSESVQE